jgi:hypothetical protein
MHFNHFETPLKDDISRWSQTDSRFTNYSSSTMKLCGLRSFAAPLIPVPGWGSQGGLISEHGAYAPGAMGPPNPGGWGFHAPSGFGGFGGTRIGSPLGAAETSPTENLMQRFEQGLELIKSW